ncbi:MAG: hypothetical protein LC133_06875 [Bacteroidales bacterium]|nr:hypothetical protein [Bacteroidales bacterium]
MVEYCEELGDEILIHMPVAPGENVISRGEDFRSGLVTIHAGCLVTSRIAGVLAACGAETVQVSSCPRIGIISTGNEAVPLKSSLRRRIRDINTWLCSGFVTGRGIPVNAGSHPMMHNHSLSLSIFYLLPVMLFSYRETEGDRICMLILSLHAIRSYPWGRDISRKP